MKRTKSVLLRLSEEEYERLKELSGREPMSAYLRRMAGLEPDDGKRFPSAFGLTEAEGAQGSGAEPQPSPPERPALFKCPVPGCDYRPASPAARCPRHARLVVPT